MEYDYPNDADGAALRNVEKHGSDMSQPMLIDFSVDVPDEATAKRVAELVAPLGFDPRLYWDDESETWSVYCAKRMLATYENVVAGQQQLNELLEPHGGYCDGWGTFGNSDGI